MNDVKWRLNISGGLGHITTGTATEENALINMGFDKRKVKDLYKNLKNDVQGTVDAHYLFNRNIGLGIKYSFFTTNGSIKQTWYQPPSSGLSNLTMNIKETDYIHFVGPSLHARSFINDSRWAFSLTVSGGYAYLYGEGEFLGFFTDYFGQPIPLRLLVIGHTFGAYGGIGLEYLLSKRIALGFDMGYSHLSFNKLKAKTNLEHTGKLDEFINNEDNNFSRLNFSFGVKIYF
jgi:outer membrane protein W